LSFKEGDRITEIEAPSEDWWQGKDKDGNVGLFPGESLCPLLSLGWWADARVGVVVAAAYVEVLE
jgi:hypothetical protein